MQREGNNWVVMVEIIGFKNTYVSIKLSSLREREREREHCLLQLDELDSNYDKNTQLYIIMYDKVNIKINIHIISH